MRTFSAQTTGISTKDQVAYMSNQRQIQNNLAKSGGANSVTLPQFSSSGLSAGPDTNDAITGMANHQLNLDANNQYTSCIDEPASSCPGTVLGGRRTRRTRRTRTRTRRYKSKRRTLISRNKLKKYRSLP